MGVFKRFLYLKISSVPILKALYYSNNLKFNFWQLKGNPQSNQRIVGTPVAFKIAQQPDKNRQPSATDSNPQQKSAAQDSTPLTLHISFLESSVTEETLRSIFEPFGIVS